MPKLFFLVLFPALLVAQQSPFTTNAQQPVTVIYSNGSDVLPTAWQPIVFTSAQPQSYQVTALSVSNPQWLQTSVLPSNVKDCNTLNSANPPANTPSGTSASLTVCYRYNVKPPLANGFYAAFITVMPGAGATWKPLRVRLNLSAFPPGYLQLFTADGLTQLSDPSTKTVTISVLNGSLGLAPSAVAVKSFDASFANTSAPFTASAFLPATTTPAPWVVITPNSGLMTNAKTPTKVSLSINAAAAACQSDLSAIVVFNLLGSTGSDYLYLAQDGPPVTCSVPPAAITQTSALAHFAAGGSYVTGFYVINKGAQSAQFSISFYGDNGSPVTLPVSGQPSSSTLSGTLPSNGSAYYEVGSSQSPLIGGWGLLNADPSIVVQSLFRNRASNGTYFEAAVASTPGSNEFQIPFDATTFAPTGSPLYTGFAIANMDSSRAANVTCTARDAGGNVIPNAITIPVLNPLGHYANYLFPALTGVRGTLDCSSNTTIGAVALRFIGDTTFSSLPVILK